MTILCAVDGDDIPNQSVTIAHDLAKTYGEELVALHLADDRPMYYIDNGATDAADTARTVVEGMIDDPDDYTPKGRVGQPTEKILKEIAQVDARFVVLGGRKRTPVGKTIFGSITQSILLNADCRVVITIRINS